MTLLAAPRLITRHLAGLVRILALIALSAAAGFGFAPAQAQSPPAGSYAASCENVSVDGANVLHATCLTPTRQKIVTTLQLPCIGSIDNINGTLVCNGATRPDLPAGSYMQSCQDIRVDAGVLRATCDSGMALWMGNLPQWRQASLQLPCSGTISNMNGTLRCDGVPAASMDAIADVRKFAPVLKFTSNGDGFGYPMSAQTFWSIWTNNGTQNGGIGKDAFGVHENTDPGTLSAGTAPTYYSYRKIGNQVRITYWWFYGMQHPCWASEGSHPGDWEHVVVILKEDRSGIAAVRFAQHNGYYLRISGPRDAPCTPDGTGRCGGPSGFPTENGRPVVYVGRTAHGSYHDTYGGIEGAGSCAYYGDARDSGGPQLDTSRALIDLDGSAEAWLAPDRAGGFSWGPDGISTHPTQDAPTASMKACKGSPTWLVENAGCYKSEGLAGDDQASQNLLKECKPGYDNAGLTCNKGKWPWEWKIYGRMNPGNYYDYDYTIPTGDVGLARRRNNEDEWNLP
jgi:hypothetical protein